MAGAFRLARPGPRLAVDAAMVLLFVSALAFRATGRAPHEWLGTGFAALLVWHGALNLGWYRSLFRGRYEPRRVLGVMTNLALSLSVLVVCVSGALNSRHVFGLAQYFDGAGLRAAHSLAAYWSLVFIGLHLGLHGNMLQSFLRRFPGRTRPALPAALPVALPVALLVVTAGVWASFERDLGSKLFLGFSFDFWEPSRPLALFYAANLGIIGLYALTAHYLRQGLGEIPRRARPETCREHRPAADARAREQKEYV